MEPINQFIVPGILFLLNLAFGFWLSHTGKPYSGLLFNLHKLLALGAVVLAVFQFTKIPRPADSFGLVIILLIIAALCVIALFASGAMMSAGRLDHTLMLIIHRVAPVGLVVSLGLVMVLLKSLL